MYLGITANRQIIYDRINKRVEAMMAAGLLKEAENLYSQRHLNALQTVGYKELFVYFDGKWGLDEAITEIKKNTRRFAKRQLTWYRKNTDVLWVDFEEDLKTVLEKLNERLENG